MRHEQAKPLGIVLISIVGVLAALMSLFGGFFSLLLTAIPGAPFLVHLVGLIFTVHAVLMLAAVYGLWVLERWGLRLTFWLYVLAIPLGIVAMFPILPGSEWSTVNTVFQLVWIGIDVAIIWYLESDDVAILYDAF
ncbi:MAG: hypothetical protein U5R48_14540 [Gammaproteobacteria bacterium]|nr:hypothetical protein [Gammaproteobacteria bacterium]